MFNPKKERTVLLHSSFCEICHFCMTYETKKERKECRIFFYKERKRTQRTPCSFRKKTQRTPRSLKKTPKNAGTPCSFIKNAKNATCFYTERKNVAFFWKERMPTPVYIMSLGRFVPWDVLSLGAFYPWNILSLGRFVLWRFGCASLFDVKYMIPTANILERIWVG